MKLSEAFDMHISDYTIIKNRTILVLTYKRNRSTIEVTYR